MFPEHKIQSIKVLKQPKKYNDALVTANNSFDDALKRNAHFLVVNF